MSYLVDTNSFSETVKPRPDPKLLTWLRLHEAELYVSTITLGEIRRGIERLPAGKRQDQLRTWLMELAAGLQERVLSFNASTAHVWGQLKAEWEREGLSIASLESQIAATAHRYGLTIVTRNVADFQKTGVKVINPFD